MRVRLEAVLGRWLRSRVREVASERRERTQSNASRLPAAWSRWNWAMSAFRVAVEAERSRRGSSGSRKRDMWTSGRDGGNILYMHPRGRRSQAKLRHGERGGRF